MVVVSEQSEYIYFVNVYSDSQNLYLMTLLINFFDKQCQLSDSCSSCALFNVCLMLNIGQIGLM